MVLHHLQAEPFFLFRQSYLSALIWRPPLTACRQRLSCHQAMEPALFHCFFPDTPTCRNPMDWSFPILCLPNSIMSARRTHFDILANIINMTMSPSPWRILPLSILRKTGMEKAKSISFSRMLPSGIAVRHFFCTFVVVPTALSQRTKRFWSSAQLFITIYVSIP